MVSPRARSSPCWRCPCLPIWCLRFQCSRGVSLPRDAIQRQHWDRAAALFASKSVECSDLLRSKADQIVALMFGAAKLL